MLEHFTAETSGSLSGKAVLNDPFLLSKTVIKGATTWPIGPWLGGQPAGGHQQAFRNHKGKTGGAKGELCVSAFKSS